MSTKTTKMEEQQSEFDKLYEQEEKISRRYQRLEKKDKREIGDRCRAEFTPELDRIDAELQRHKTFDRFFHITVIVACISTIYSDFHISLPMLIFLWSVYFCLWYLLDQTAARLRNDRRLKQQEMDHKFNVEAARAYDIRLNQEQAEFDRLWASLGMPSRDVESDRLRALPELAWLDDAETDETRS